VDEERLRKVAEMVCVGDKELGVIDAVKCFWRGGRPGHDCLRRQQMLKTDFLTVLCWLHEA
jgi:hypothetical protein